MNMYNIGDKVVVYEHGLLRERIVHKIRNTINENGKEITEYQFKTEGRDWAFDIWIRQFECYRIS